MVSRPPSLDDLGSATTEYISMGISDIRFNRRWGNPDDIDFKLQTVSPGLPTTPSATISALNDQIELGEYYRLSLNPTITTSSGNALFTLSPIDTADDRTLNKWNQGLLSSVVLEESMVRAIGRQYGCDPGEGELIDGPIFCIPNKSQVLPSNAAGYQSPNVDQGSAQVTITFSSSRGSQEIFPTFKCISISNPLGESSNPNQSRLSAWSNDEDNAFELIQQVFPGKKFRTQLCYDIYGNQSYNDLALEFKNDDTDGGHRQNDEDLISLYNFAISTHFDKALTEDHRIRKGQGTGEVTGIVEFERRNGGKSNFSL
ncbi:hypothetical protein V866_001583 [Kwoniella sp. B9012]